MSTTERISIELSSELLERLDGIRQQLGLRSRSAFIERLIKEVLENNGEQAQF